MDIQKLVGKGTKRFYLCGLLTKAKQKLPKQSF